MESNVLCVKEYLKSQHMNVLDEWLEGCVQFFHEQRRYSNQELSNMARGQWLLSDLTEICPGCLPSNLNNQSKAQLTGIYVVQLNYIVDIGVSAYQQLLKLTKVDTGNIDVTATNNQIQYPEPTSQRMLKLLLTDGVQEISGMEYRPMRNLSIDLTPGTKLQIKGPVNCRRGVLMLEEKHVTVLGGEVDDLVRKNQYKNILTEIVKSNAEINPNSDVLQFIRESSTRSNEMNTQQNSNRHFNNRQENSEDLRRSPGQYPAVVPVRQNIDEEEINNLNNDIFNDDFDLDAIAKIENTALQSSSSGQAKPQPVIKKIRLETSKQNSATGNVSPFNEYTMENDFINDCDFLQHDEEEEYLKMMQNEDNFNDNCRTKSSYDETHMTLPLTINREPFVYIKQLVDSPQTILQNKKFTVKAQVIAIINKLKFKNGDWDLKCKICDGTSFLDVDVSGNILSSLVGFTSSEMSKMKNEMASNSQLKQRVVQGLTEAHRKLQTIDSLLEILYKPSGPCIVGLTEYTDQHLRELDRRT